MRVLVTGATGQLGRDVCIRLGSEAAGIATADLDITDRQAAFAYITESRPDAIVHCAAYTAVDKAESEPELCHAVNVLGTRHLAEAAKGVGAKFLYVSTDYVFDGELDRPYEVDDAVNPLSVYGRTKLEGEMEVSGILEERWIVRTSWLYGLSGGNFVKTMLRVGRERGGVGVVSDQIGSPTYSADLAELIALMIRTDKYGVYHATNEGFCSWFDFAQGIFATADMNVETMPLASAEYPTAAVRPKDSRLSKKSLTDAGFDLLPPWQDALGRFIHQGHF